MMFFEKKILIRALPSTTITFVFLLIATALFYLLTTNSTYSVLELLPYYIFGLPLAFFLALINFISCLISGESMLNITLTGLTRYCITSVINFWIAYGVLISIWTDIPYNVINPAASDMFSPPKMFTAFDSAPHFFRYFVVSGFVFSLIMTLALICAIVIGGLLWNFMRRLIGKA